MVKFVIGITGGSGVGKTTLINMLYEEFPDRVATFSLDNYYRPKDTQLKDENGIINFDLPSALDLEDMKQDLEDLLQGNIVSRKQYMFNNPASEAPTITVRPEQLLIVEGIFVMHYPFVRNMLNYSVFLEVDEEIQLERRLKRDVEQRNYSYDEVMYQWNYHVKPAYMEFVLPYKSDVDLIITNNSDFDHNIGTLMDVIHKNIDKVET